MPVREWWASRRRVVLALATLPFALVGGADRDIVAGPRCSAGVCQAGLLQDGADAPALELLQQANQKIVRIDALGEESELEDVVSKDPPPGMTKVGINLSVKWMSKPLPPAQAIAAIKTVERVMKLSRPIQRVKTFDFSRTNVEIVEELVAHPGDIEELIVGIGNEDLWELDITWLGSVARRWKGTMHVAVGNEPDRESIPAMLVSKCVQTIKANLPGVKVSVPFAYSIMEVSYPVNEAEFNSQFTDNYRDILPMLDYITINIYPFLSAGLKSVPFETIMSPTMPFLTQQIAAFKVALRKMLPSGTDLPIAIGETGWPSCGANRFRPYSFATVNNSMTYMQAVAQWIEGNWSDGVVLSGNLFTTFDEETKGTRAIERYYGILASDGSPKTEFTCTTNATEPSVAWLEADYPECETDLNWMVENFEDTRLAEKFTGRGISGSLCSFQQYLYDRWASCPPVFRPPGYQVPSDGVSAWGETASVTKCSSWRLVEKYTDRGPTTAPLPGSTRNPFAHHKTSSLVSARARRSPWERSAAADPLRETLRVYWINLDASVDRREAMQHRFDELEQTVQSGTRLDVTRVPAVTTDEVRAMMLNGSLSVQADLIDHCTLACPMHHSRGELLVSEVAVTLSHLRAAELAAASGAEYALILEDDVHPYRALLAELPDVLHAAPGNWSALQLATTSTLGLLSLASTQDMFLPWQPRFYSTAAYLLSRSGAEELHRMYGARNFTRPANSTAGSLQTESLIFGSLPATSVHTSSKFYFNFMEFPTTIHRMAADANYFLVSNLRWQINFLDVHRQRLQHGGLSQAYGKGRGLLQEQGRDLLSLPRPPWRRPAQSAPPSQQLSEPLDDLQPGPSSSKAYGAGQDNHTLGGVAPVLPLDRLAGEQPPTILAMTTLICKKGRKGFLGEIQNIANSVRSLNGQRYNWTVFVIVEDERKAKHRACPALEKTPEMHLPNVKVVYRATPGRFSKWVYYTEEVNEFEKFDYLVVFDADMGLSTFNWREFWSRRALYASRWGDAPVVGVLRNETPFHPLRSEWWADCGRQDVRFVEADFVEQWFAMLSGPFAAWFLKRVVDTGLIREQVTLGVDWGVDGAWCAAAAEWAGRDAGCLLVTMDMYHGDTKSLKQDVTFHQNGEHLNNIWWSRVPQWMKASEVWLGAFFQDVSNKCSPLGVDERYHMPQKLRLDVPVVPTGPPAGNKHKSRDGDEDSGGTYVEKEGGKEKPNATASSTTAAAVNTSAAAPADSSSSSSMPSPSPAPSPRK